MLLEPSYRGYSHTYRSVTHFFHRILGLRLAFDLTAQHNPAGKTSSRLGNNSPTPNAIQN